MPDAVQHAQPLPGTPGLLGALALAAVLVLWHPAWRVARYAATACHEGGHAVVAALVGRRLSGIRLERDSSGVTVSRGRPTGPGVVATMLAGYPAPSLAGLGAVLLAAAGRPAWVLVAALLGVAALAVWVRNVFGWVVVLGLGALVWAGLYRAPGEWLGGVACAIGFFLLLAAVRDVIGLAQATSFRTSDAHQLARLTGVPRLLWVALFLFVTLANLWLAAWVLW